MNELFKRAFFGLIFLAFVFVPLWIDFNYKTTKYFVLTLLTFSIIGTYELAKLSSSYHQRKNKLLAGYILIFVFFFFPVAQIVTGEQYLLQKLSGMSYSNEKLIFFTFFLALPLFSVLFLSVNAFIPKMNRNLYHFPLLLNFLYIIVPLVCLSYIYINAYGYIIIPLLIIALSSTYINDSFAYIFGRLFGKHKMFPLISPKKTWEGFIGGLLILTIIGIISYSNFEIGKVIYVCFFALIVSILSTLGDLFESRLKRLANVKDSGTILPGHGGILDRIDAMLFTTYFATITLFLMQLLKPSL